MSSFQGYMSSFLRGGAMCHDRAKGVPWQFFCDSDFAGNTEEQNRMRSQNGFIDTCDGAPVLYGSKVSSVAFAHPDIGESHADVSSGANEICAAGNAKNANIYLTLPMRRVLTSPSRFHSKWTTLRLKPLPKTTQRRPSSSTLMLAKNGSKFFATRAYWYRYMCQRN